MRIAVLAVQGAFAEHQRMLESLGVDSFQIRNLNDWLQPKDGLIIPGGESTSMTRILNDEHLFEPLRQAILEGLPVFGTCAGMIMLDDKHLNTMDMTVRRNAYGRQLGSFYTEHPFEGLGSIPMTFIRAPYIERIGADVEILSILDNHIIAARQHNMLVTSFHPELNENLAVHRFWIERIVKPHIES